MSDVALQFEDGDVLGRVAGVDTHRISIAIDNPTLVTRIGVGDLTRSGEQQNKIT